MTQQKCFISIATKYVFSLDEVFNFVCIWQMLLYTSLFTITGSK